MLSSPVIDSVNSINVTPSLVAARRSSKQSEVVLGKYWCYYTPGIYAEGYIVFVFLFVSSFVCTSFRRVEFASKFCVKVSQVMYISATTHQKAFIFGP